MRSVHQALLGCVVMGPILAIACGGADQSSAPPIAVNASGSGGTAGVSGASGSSSGGNAGTGGVNPCEPPDVIIALDRTLTMAQTPSGQLASDAPDYASARFALALEALKGLTSASVEQTVRFGLEMWPKDPGGCVTLAERLTGSTPTNPDCEEGEILVEPDLGTSAKIASFLDPKTAHVCKSTPTGQGLLTASTYLDAHKVSGRGQYVMLVTDGSDWNVTCPDPAPLAVTQTLAKNGIKTFVVGFSNDGTLNKGGVGAPFLNNMACAGQTATGFPAGCTETADGYVATDPAGESLFLLATDGAGLTSALKGVAGSICCDCLY